MCDRFPGNYGKEAVAVRELPGKRTERKREDPLNKQFASTLGEDEDLNIELLREEVIHHFRRLVAKRPEA